MTEHGDEIKCDGCDADLTYTANCVDYRLVLGNESKPTYPGAGAVTAMGIYPPVERTHHFCGLGCLDHWRDREKHRSKLWREWSDKWQEEKGHKSPDGRVTSWPSPPEELRKANDAAFAAAALEAYPLKRPVRDGRPLPADEVKAFVDWLDGINDKRTLGPWSHEPADGGLVMTETKEVEGPTAACIADPGGDIICNAEYDNLGEEHDETASRREYDLAMIVALVNAWPMIRAALLAVDVPKENASA
jgi:hypothetical protein